MRTPAMLSLLSATLLGACAPTSTNNTVGGKNAAAVSLHPDTSGVTPLNFALTESQPTAEFDLACAYPNTPDGVPGCKLLFDLGLDPNDWTPYESSVPITPGGGQAPGRWLVDVTQSGGGGSGTGLSAYGWSESQYYSGWIGADVSMFAADAHITVSRSPSLPAGFPDINVALKTKLTKTEIVVSGTLLDQNGPAPGSNVLFRQSGDASGANDVNVTTGADGSFSASLASQIPYAIYFGNETDPQQQYSGISFDADQDLGSVTE